MLLRESVQAQPIPVQASALRVRQAPDVHLPILPKKVPSQALVVEARGVPAPAQTVTLPNKSFHSPIRSFPPSR